MRVFSGTLGLVTFAIITVTTYKVFCWIGTTAESISDRTEATRWNWVSYAVSIASIPLRILCLIFGLSFAVFVAGLVERETRFGLW
jgi:hypothetical protein